MNCSKIHEHNHLYGSLNERDKMFLLAGCLTEKDSKNVLKQFMNWYKDNMYIFDQEVGLLFEYLGLESQRLIIQNINSDSACSYILWRSAVKSVIQGSDTSEIQKKTDSIVKLLYEKSIVLPQGWKDLVEDELRDGLSDGFTTMYFVNALNGILSRGWTNEIHIESPMDCHSQLPYSLIGDYLESLEDDDQMH